jgi:hypothetical protein
LQFTLAVLLAVTRGFQTLALFLLLVGLRAVMAERQDRQLLLRADEVLRPLGASGRKRSKLLQCRWEIAERFLSIALLQTAALLHWFVGPG